ncbi:STN domain-containing protein [Bremerella sp. T1]|uniref:STN domain-containing protein n=1 Tax=Bremerella sp. TYQ1 TaxID=3119568 RepID=UPI001CCFCE28|nr:STN domain-containing protein [Bremerella volcania]UBM37596.1 hypothetical protein LA756_06825 [Bremerella volcania]
MRAYSSVFLNLLLGVLTAAFSQLNSPLLAQAPTDWRTEADLDKQLESTFDLTWEDVPLREGLMRLGKTQRVAIFLDRRINPDRPISMTFTNERLELALQRIAAELRLGMSRVGDVIYFGPEETARRLPTVAQLQSQFAKSSGIPEALKFLDQKKYSWPKLATPHEILMSVAEDHGMTWNNLDEVIKHDLWPAADFPAMRTTEYLSLVLAGYHASYRFDKQADGIKLQLVPIPEDLSLTRIYPYSGSHDEAIKKIQELFPEAKVQSDGKRQLAVTGSQQIQDQVAKLLRGGTARNTVVMPGEKRYTLKVEQLPLGPVLDALEKQLGKEFDVPEGMEEELKQRISFDVNAVDLAALLEAIFQETEFAYQVEESKIVIRKK